LILTVHAPDQRSNLCVDPWTAADMAGLSAPVSAEAASAPADHGLRLNDNDRIKELFATL